MITKYVCEEHIDDAMDDLINEFETFPLIEKDNSQQCSYCTKISIYKVEVTE